MSLLASMLKFYVKDEFIKAEVVSYVPYNTPIEFCQIYVSDLPINFLRFRVNFHGENKVMNQI
jgi:hypothetical protein